MRIQGFKKTGLLFFAPLLWLLFLNRCGDSSLVTCQSDSTTAQEVKKGQCSPKTDDEVAIIALNEKKYDTAIVILQSLITKEPTAYYRHARVSSAYAGKAEFDILKITQVLQGEGDIEERLTTVIKLPEAGKLSLYTSYIDNMRAAIDTLVLIPEDQRKKDSDNTYGASAELQLTLYQSVFGVMMLKYSEAILAELQTIPEDDATLILDSLQSAKDNSATNYPELSEAIGATLTAIKTSQGISNAKKLENYMKGN